MASTLSPSSSKAVCAMGRCAQRVGIDRHFSWPSLVEVLPKVDCLTALPLR